MFGFALRGHREQSERTLKQVASALGWSQSTLSRLETGRKATKPDQVSPLLDAYEVTDALMRADLTQMAFEADVKGWLRPYKTAATNHALAQASFENMAQRMRIYDSSSIPGLLQTEDYARAVVGLGKHGRDPGKVERLVELRMERQRRFAAADKKLICVLDEASLIRPYGSCEVMYRQLDHLLTLSYDPRYVLQVAELKRFDMPVWSSATIFDFPDKPVPDIAYIEEHDTAFYVSTEDEVDEREKVFDLLRSASLRSDLSRSRIRHLRDHAAKQG